MLEKIIQKQLIGSLHSKSSFSIFIHLIYYCITLLTLISFFIALLQLLKYYIEFMSQQPTCQIFGPVGVIVQIFLGVLSFAVLVLKRYKQHPKRPWKIWVMDTSKQAASMFIAHFLNVAISLKLSFKLDGDPCIWYFATIMMDTTLGMLICIGILRLLQIMILQGRFQKYQSGNYYQIVFNTEEAYTTYNESKDNTNNRIQPLQISYKKEIIIINYPTWIIQFIIWNTIVVIMKTMLFIIQDLISGPLMRVSMFLMGWITKYPNLELVVVMFIVPVIMNALAFWIQDNFLMKKKKQQKQDSIIGQSTSTNRQNEKSEIIYEQHNEPLLKNEPKLNQELSLNKKSKKYELEL